MPLLATLVGSIATGLAGFFSSFMSFKLALKLAAYTTWVAITVAMLAATFVCIHNLWALGIAYFNNSGGMSTAGGAIAIALGVIVSSNAATVLACCSSVWIATQIYKMQKQGLINWGS